MRKLDYIINNIDESLIISRSTILECVYPKKNLRNADLSGRSLSVRNRNLKKYDKIPECNDRYAV